MAKVSIIIPVYNKERFVERCLNSIVNQIDKNAQVIIVNDGSTDNSNTICKKYIKENNWELYSIPHSGVSAARNYGLKKVKSDYVTFLDSDDTLTTDAIEKMNSMVKDDEFNIIQFGMNQINGGVCHTYKMAERGDYKMPESIRYWQFVTNKLFKMSFLKEHKIKFNEDLEFGEDEMFVVDAFLANNGVRQASVVLYEHHLDDKNSICRGTLDIEKLKILERQLRKRMAKQIKEGKDDKWIDGLIWLANELKLHYESKTFKRFGFAQKKQGKYDIVYFVKNTPHNEELRYSLRSVEENWPYKDVWFYGGCPNGIEPDFHISCVQNSSTKWQNVRNMMREACMNDAITENFWLFNDDFFILKPMDESVTAYYDGTITSKIDEIKAKHHGEHSEWSSNLEKLKKCLENACKPELCYAVHAPMLINRKKMLKTLDENPNEPMVRALYGNWWEIGGQQLKDPKYSSPNDRDMSKTIAKQSIISTSDDSFRAGYVGRWLRDRFQNKSRFEE